MKYLILSILTFITHNAFAQTEIKLEDVKNHIGDSVKLTAKIYGVKYIESAQGTPTFLNVGNKYPKAPLTLVIWGDTRKQFHSAPETTYTGLDITRHSLPLISEHSLPVIQSKVYQFGVIWISDFSPKFTSWS